MCAIYIYILIYNMCVCETVSEAALAVYAKISWPRAQILLNQLVPWRPSGILKSPTTVSDWDGGCLTDCDWHGSQQGMQHLETPNVSQ